MRRSPFLFLAPLAVLACSSSSTPSTNHADGGTPLADSGSSTDASNADVSAEDASIVDAVADVDKSATCVLDANGFGQSLTNAFGRVDGTLVSVIPPDDQSCADPNSTHLILEVAIPSGIYRMVVDVLSSTAPTNVLFYETDAPLAGGPWSEGWNTTIDGFDAGPPIDAAVEDNAPDAGANAMALDYVTNLGLHTTQFTSMSEDDVVAKITSELTLGSHVSVYSTSAGEPDSTHLVHRNLTNQDGAIVINPETAPHYMLIQFGDQSF
jgi:hypothetical protein